MYSTLPHRHSCVESRVTKYSFWLSVCRTSKSVSRVFGFSQFYLIAVFSSQFRKAAGQEDFRLVAKNRHENNSNMEQPFACNVCCGVICSTIRRTRRSYSKASSQTLALDLTMKINADAADIILRGVTSGTERLVNAFGIISEITANNKTGLCVYAALKQGSQ